MHGHDGTPDSGPALTLSATSHSTGAPQAHAALLTIRNVSGTAQPFELEGSHHWQWSAGAWSRPRSVSWIPIHGEALIAIPHLDAGQYRAGVLSNPDLSGTIHVAP